MPIDTFLSIKAVKAAVIEASDGATLAAVGVGEAAKMSGVKRVKSVGTNARQASVKRSRFWPLTVLTVCVASVRPLLSLIAPEFRTIEAPLRARRSVVN